MNIPEDYKNMNSIATSSNKQLRDWINRKVGKDAIAKFTASHPEVENPIIVIKGRGKNQGTYAHPELAAIFAAWCDPQFPGFQQKVIEFQRTKIQAMLPFIPDSIIQKQIESGQNNRAIDLLRGDTDPGSNVELIADWVKRQNGDPRAVPTAKRLVESPGNLKPGSTYGLAGYSRESKTFKVAFDRWDDFECLLASLEPHYNLSIEDVNKWLDRIDAVRVPE